MHFIQFLAINFRDDTLGGFQKVEMSNTRGRPTDSHPNLPFMQFWSRKVFKCFVRIKSLSQSFTIVTKNPFFVISHHSINKWCFAATASNTFQNVKFFTFIFMLNPFIKFFQLTNFLEMTWNWWNTENHCLSHFYDTLMRV